LVNVTDGKVIRLLVNDEPFDIRYAICMNTRACWTFEPVNSSDGRTGRHRRQPDPGHLDPHVSMVQRAIAAIKYEVEAVDAVRVVVQSELVANEPANKPAGFDPRAALELDSPWTALDHQSHDAHAELVTRPLQRSAGLHGHGS